MEQQNVRWSGRVWRVLRTIFWGFLGLQVLFLVFGGLRKSVSDYTDDRPRVACIRVDGLISDSTFLVKKISKFARNEDIRGLLVRVDSPGGYPGSSQAIFNELKRFKEHKPVVVLVENSCASAAYYLASAADYIIAPANALVGSIGALTELPNYKELLSYCKVDYSYVQSGSYKTAGSPVKQMSASERAYLQSICDDTYNQFVLDVAQSRGIDPKAHQDWADGKIFTGNQALALHLIDKIGSYSDALEQLRQRIGLDADARIKFVYPKRPSKIEKLLGMSKDDLGLNSSADWLAGLCCLVWQRLACAGNVPYTH